MPVTHAEPTDRTVRADQNVLEAALHWGDSLLAVRRLKADGELTLGSSDDADLYVADPSLVSALQQFVTRHGDEVWLQPVEGLTLLVDGEPAPPVATRLTRGSDARFSVGALEIRLRWTGASRTIRVPLLGGLDFLYTKVLTLALLLQAALVAGMMLTPTFTDDDDSLIAQAVRWVQVETPKEKETKTKPKPKQTKQPVLEKETQKVFGQDRRKVAKATANVRRDERDLAQAAANEVLAAMFGAEGKRGGGSGVMDDLDAAVTGLSTHSRPAGGGNGLGSRGVGPGGGGGSIGIGDLRSGKGGIGGDDGIDLCRGDGCGKKRYGVTRTGTVKTVGSLKREEIQRVVNRHLSQIKACFNKELTKDPNLEGKVTMSWVIGESGAVVMSKVSQDTVRSPGMSVCVKRVIDRMKFPRPRGGGTVNVRYPFLFST